MHFPFGLQGVPAGITERICGMLHLQIPLGSFSGLYPNETITGQGIPKAFLIFSASGHHETHDASQPFELKWQ